LQMMATFHLPLHLTDILTACLSGQWELPAAFAFQECLSALPQGFSGLPARSR